MGAVYLARDDELGRDVAVKTVRTRGLGEIQQVQFRERFWHEARAVAALSHAHVVALYDMGVEDETPYLVMERASGPSLREVLSRGPLPARAVRTLGIQIAGALGAAHARGILHRDVKPANILAADGASDVAESGPSGTGVSSGSISTWKLADFGIARVPSSTLTLAGEFLGSPAYAAPEAVAEGAFSPASDVFGLAATLYEAASGALPYGDSGLRRSDASSVPPPPHLGARCPQLSSSAASAIMAGLDRDPARRPTADILARALALDSRAPAPHASRRGWVLGAAIAAALIAGVLIGNSDSGRAPAPAAGSRPGLGQPDPGVEARPGLGQPDPRADRGAPEAPTQRHGKHAKRWDKAIRALRKGDRDKAIRELYKLLDHDPYDYEAQALLDELEALP
jgi:serine/threonine protein kinase